MCRAVQARARARIPTDGAGGTGAVLVPLLPRRASSGKGAGVLLLLRAGTSCHICWFVARISLGRRKSTGTPLFLPILFKRNLLLPPSHIN
ncbi:hypothetical protein BRADI_3g52175v3 [Brachypodium distachyon]|uniref:Uncharacterized protein n=1 Tax=Brachypodium distachyon TaxID=15368 RepID=A0A2K2D4Q7_BRADI|nr:hypothetical protein BRADI_3g52175v3 [Brachypodium distachyon]